MSEPGSAALTTYRDGSRIIVGPVERLYIERLHERLADALEDRHKAEVAVERHRHLVAAAKRVVSTLPSGKSVAVDLAAYNDLRDVLGGLGALD